MAEREPGALPLAVYGSLRRGFALPGAPQLSQALSARGPCMIPGRLVDLGDYPGLVDGPGRVCGELFAVRDRQILSLLDEYEEYDPHDPVGSVYVRRAVLLLEPRVQAWVYSYNGERAGRPVIASGDWAAHVGG